MVSFNNMHQLVTLHNHFRFIKTQSPKYVEALSFNKAKVIVKCNKLVHVIKLYRDARSTKYYIY
jgi:hypothetical protein